MLNKSKQSFFGKVIIHRIPSVLSLAGAGIALVATMAIGKPPLEIAFITNLSHLSSYANTELFSASPNPIPVCDDSGVGTTTLSWNTPAGTPVEVHRDGGSLVTQGTGPGSRAISNVEDGTEFSLFGIITNSTLKYNKKTQKWVRGSITEKKLLARLKVEHTNEACGQGGGLEPLTVGFDLVGSNTMAVSTTPGGSYTVAAWYKNRDGGPVPYEGLLDFSLRRCEINNSSACTNSTGAWGGYRLVNGRVYISLPPTIADGVYNVTFKARNSSESWSNEVAVTVRSLPPLRTPTQIMSGSLSSELGGAGGNIYAPEILYEDGIYKMWYGGQGTDGHDRIHYAESTDSINWTKFGVVIDNGEYDHVNDPSVVKIGSTYYMYYDWGTQVMSNGRVTELGAINLATSTDGRNWTKQGVVLSKSSQPWNTRYVLRPSVLYDGGQWKMWFDSESTDPQYPQRYVGYATSTDGRAWNIRPDWVFTGGAVDVKKVGNKYIMLQEWQQGTLLAVSSDGITWTDKGPLFRNSGTDFDRYGQVTPFLLLNPTTGKPQAIYFGGASVATWNGNRIGIYRLDGDELDPY